MLSSKAYSGFVTHVRHRPKNHRLKYGLSYLLLDLDELPALDTKLRLFAYNRAAPFSFHDIDHGPRDGTSLRAWVDTQLANVGVDAAGGRIRLLCLPRMLGYVFNPISVYFCYDGVERLRAILYEVRNTFGESHTYIVPTQDDGRAVQSHSFDKEFYVSPFIPMDCTYDMAVLPPGDRVSITVSEADPDGALLAATFNGEARTLTDRFLAASLVCHPMMTLKVIVGIYWEAFQLWRKRIPTFRHPSAPAEAVSFIVPNAGVPHGRSDTKRPTV
ncbi:MAG: DUF1365 domain-containing protein [Alphaproteobacteria bacterium]|nr:DUF1365 domain-containing protein [Alphaproteobacteria bacterium]